MDIRLSAQGGDITTWRAAENFTVAYRQALLDQAASDHADDAEAVFSEAKNGIDSLYTAHLRLIAHMDSLISEVSNATPSANLKDLTNTFYSELYQHFSLFHSPTAFYQYSMAYLRQISAAVTTQAIHQLGLFARHLPELSLIALGAAGRCEYSPFCQLQLLLVHGEVTPPQLETIDLFCHTLHDCFEAAGVAMDPVITPRTPQWRGTLTIWQRNCQNVQHPQSDEEMIRICRLVDQYPLHAGCDIARELKKASSTALHASRPTLSNLIDRMSSLSNGLGIMGGLRLERNTTERGMFKLLDHGLLPFSAALSTLALLKECDAPSASERIYELLKRRELDVELAERMLVTWHALHNLRLTREQAYRASGITTVTPLLLNPNELTAAQLDSLKKNLETVAHIQRHAEIAFSGMGE